MTLFTAILIASYAAVMGVLFIAALRKNKNKNAETEKFSILVPAKDEATRIGACLAALAAQNFPKSDYEVIVLNDNSADNTSEVASASTADGFALRVVSVEQNKTLVGKANAINQGVALAHHSIVVICDADCEPNANWLKCISRQFAPQIDVVSGFTLLGRDKKTLFGQLQNIDWIYLLGIGAAAARLGFPISCIGSNLAFRKSIYERVGGYEKLKFSITEDLSLYKAFAKENPRGFSFAVDAESINWSHPMNTISEFYAQRKRWVLGSFDLNILGGMLLSLALLAHLLPAYAAVASNNVAGISALLAIDFIVLSGFFIRLKQYILICLTPFYMIFYFFNLFAIPVVLLFARRVEWKGRVYNRKGVVD